MIFILSRGATTVLAIMPAIPPATSALLDLPPGAGAGAGAATGII
jgi:hypothetical protein